MPAGYLPFRDHGGVRHGPAERRLRRGQKGESMGRATPRQGDKEEWEVEERCEKKFPPFPEPRGTLIGFQRARILSYRLIEVFSLRDRVASEIN